jgi:Winged helix DNA-binding domain
MRAAQQLIHRPRTPSHPADIARAIAGAQAQDARAGRLTFRARDARLTATDVDRARTEERSLLLTWAMRNTLHLLNAEDAVWMLPLFRPKLEGFARRRLAHFGVDGRAQERGLEAVRAALAEEGALSRGEVSERIERRRIRITPERRMHFTLLSVATGVACLGPDAGRSTQLVLADEWMGPPPRHDHEAALRDLARRYLGAFGPATEADFAGWAGLPLGDIRTGLTGIASELRRLRLGDARAFALRRAARRAPVGVVRLLAAWDTYLLGYRDRAFVAPPERWRKITPGGGMYYPAIVRDGAAIGTWAIRGPRDKPEITTQPFGALDSETREAVRSEIADVRRFERLPERAKTG